MCGTMGLDLCRGDGPDADLRDGVVRLVGASAVTRHANHQATPLHRLQVDVCRRADGGIYRDGARAARLLYAAKVRV